MKKLILSLLSLGAIYTAHALESNDSAAQQAPIDSALQSSAQDCKPNLIREFFMSCGIVAAVGGLLGYNGFTTPTGCACGVIGAACLIALRRDYYNKTVRLNRTVGADVLIDMRRRYTDEILDTSTFGTALGGLIGCLIPTVGYGQGLAEGICGAIAGAGLGFALEEYLWINYMLEFETMGKPTSYPPKQSLAFNVTSNGKVK
jgi:hypothetical protein